MSRNQILGGDLLLGFREPEPTRALDGEPARRPERETRRPEAPRAQPPLAPYLAAASAGVLCILGLVMIYSASALPNSLPGGPGEFHHVSKQAAFLLAALGVMAVAACAPWSWVRRAGPVALAVAALGLALVLIPGIGHEVNGARRWFRYEGLGIQVSDFAKLALILFLASYLGKDPARTRSFLRGTVPAMGAVALVAGLVVVEPDFGTALFLAALGGCLAVAGGIRWTHLAPPFLAGLAGMALLVWRSFDHVRDRVAVFLDPTLDPLGKGHQVRQSLIALGSGGVFGSGLGASRQKLFFLPEDFTDFILALVGEEMGLLGTLLVVGCFLVFTVSALSIARRARTETGFLVALGVTILVSLQGFINVAVVTASAPTKGISLPFVSYGGSSLMIMMAALGLLLNVSRGSDAPGPATEDEPGPDSVPDPAPA
ncbi:MAG: putative lipid II flippase FtsW [Planctomycetes bacterium]|nr:putative lipid II flippase FtsW [Planctomycetota bacterium]